MWLTVPASARAGIRPAALLFQRALATLRRYTFLPMLVAVVPAVVVFRGGDALSICFNTVAVLFLSEVE